MYELSLINAYKQGRLNGITEADTCFYIPLRITGLGESVRFSDGEPFIENRDKATFLRDEAMFHFANLPILREHPKNALLNSENLKDNQIIGQTLCAYLKDNEIWGIARIYDKTLMGELNKYQSTSPAISAFHSTHTEHSNEYPLMINHLAFVEKGHWDIGDSVGYDLGDGSINKVLFEIKEA